MKHALFILSFICLIGIQGQACLCEDFAFTPDLNETHLDELNHRIVIGTVVKVRKKRIPFYKTDKEISRYQRKQKRTINRATIELRADYSSDLSSKRINVNTGTMSFLDCGFPFEEGVEYLIVMYKTDRGYWTSICSPTKPLSAAEADLNFLDKLERERISN